jgi:molybdopterin-binding protein
VVEIAQRDLRLRAPAAADLNGATPLAALLPRDRVRVAPGEAAGENSHSGVIRRTLFTGSVFEVVLDLDGGTELQATVAPSAIESLGVDALAVGRRVVASWAPRDIVLVRDE